MLSSVSWSQYFTFLFIAVMLWYIFLWLVIYKGKFPGFAAMCRSQTPSFHHQGEDDEMARYIMDEISPVLSGKTNKAEIILSLRQIVMKYVDHTEPGFRRSINEFLIMECQSKCSIRLSEADLREVWS